MKIGVLIPDRGDRPEFLANCIRMLERQTLKPHVVELVNDPPKNDDIDITYRYRIGYERFSGKGVDLIAFIENDDWYASNYLELHAAKWRENTIFDTDTERKMKVYITGLDCGFHTTHAHTFIDKTNCSVFGLKGKDVEVYTRSSIVNDVPAFHVAKERNKLFLVEVNAVKDDLADLMKLKWDESVDKQPPGFMNYPQPAKGMYGFKNFFGHYEAEHRVFETKTTGQVVSRWKKKTSVSQNHFWDVRVYNMTIRDILVSLVCKELKLKNYTWEDYVDLVLQRRKAA